MKQPSGIRIAVAMLGLALLSTGLRSKDLLELRERREGGAIAVEAVNNDPYAPRWAWIQMQGAQNARPDVPLPQGFVLAPRQQRILFFVRPQDPSQGFRYGLQQRSGEGDPTREPDARHVYLLPYAHGAKQNLTQAYFGSATHQGLHALDFDLAEGSAVHAARAGVVIAVKQDSSQGGSSRLYADEGNYVQVMHEDSSWALYAHLQRQGALVRVGDRVSAGQRLALSGSTGLASGPHLHFAVYRADWNGPRTVPTVFKTGLTETASLEEGRSYYAYHPGGAPFKTELGEDLDEATLRGVTRSAQGGKVRLREQKLDRRVVVWAVNPTDSPISLEADVSQATGTRASTVLPLKLQVPPRTEVYAFHLDLVGLQSAYRLGARWRPLNKGSTQP